MIHCNKVRERISLQPTNSNDNDFIPTPLPQNLISVRRKIALLIALVIIVSIPVSYLLWSLYIHRYGTLYEREIIRKPANLQEAFALATAEYSNYSDIFSKSRLTPIGPHDPMSYTWANFIDAEVVQYYSERFDNLTGKAWDKPKEIRLRYEANVFTWDQIRVVYIPAPEGTSSYNSKIQIQSSNGSVLLENAPYHGPAWDMEFAQWNGSDHHRINASEIDFSLSKSYVVEMSLRYSETWGPLAAFIVDAYQLIIVDDHFVAVLLCVQSSQGIS
jgi:hypothetical protein